tara:strand:- start:2177 stop:2422 length:246 start_codon:yes stop_codon:yes gene_type:complete
MDAYKNGYHNLWGYGNDVLFVILIVPLLICTIVIGYLLIKNQIRLSKMGPTLREQRGYYEQIKPSEIGETFKNPFKRKGKK